MGLAGVSLGRELRALALSHTRFGAAWHRLSELGHKLAPQTALPYTANHRLHQGKQPLREERVGKAVPGLAHRVGAEW